MKYLVISDIHANEAALEAVLAAESDWDEVLFLGDAVDYGPLPNETVERLAEQSGTFLMGNHDRTAVAEPGPQPPAGRRNFSQWTRGELTDSNKSIIRGYTETETVTSGRRTIRVHHGNFDGRFDSVDVPRRLTPQTGLEAFDAVDGLFEESVIMFGHSHRQFDLTVNGTRFINPGSVGRESMNGLALQYATLEDGEIRMKETDYDSAPTISATESLPIDETPTIWQRCLKRELYRLRGERGAIPDRNAIAEESRYEPSHYVEEFGSLEAALESANLR